MDELTPFAFWCQKAMPAVLDNSLSFYEVLCKLTAKLNDAIETINGHSELITTMQSEIAALQTLTAQHTQQIADLTKKVQANANNITAINTRTKGLSTKTDSKNNYWGINFTTDDNYVYRLAWSNGAPAASVLQTSRPGSIYYQNGGVSDDWAYLSVQDGTNTSRPGYTSISRTIYNQITSDINDVESSATQNAQAIKALQDLTSDHSMAISSLQDSVGKNTQDITNLNNGLSSTNQTVAKLESSLETLNTRTKGISTKTDASNSYQAINFTTDAGKVYRIGWIGDTPSSTVASSSDKGSFYFYVNGTSQNTGNFGWSQLDNSFQSIYNGILKTNMTTLSNTVSKHTQQISTLMNDVNNNVSDINDLQTNLASATNTITQVGTLANEINTRTKGLSTKTDSSDNWIGISLSTDDSSIYRVAWSNETPALPVLQQSSPGSLYLRIGGPVPDIWLYAWDQDGTDTAMPLATVKI